MAGRCRSKARGWEIGTADHERDAHAVDDTFVELDYEAARSTFLKVTQVEPSHGFVAWQALVDGYVPESLNDPADALQPTLATRVAEYEHQFKVIDEAQKTFVVREMMPKDIKREFLTGPRK